MCTPLNINKVRTTMWNDSIAGTMIHSIDLAITTLTKRIHLTSTAISLHEEKINELIQKSNDYLRGNIQRNVFEEHVRAQERYLQVVDTESTTRQNLPRTTIQEQYKIDFIRAVLLTRGDEVSTELRDKALAAADALQKTLDAFINSVHALIHASQDLSMYTGIARTTILGS